MKKGDILENLRVEGIGTEGKAMAKLDGRVIWIKYAVPGDIVTARVTKVRSAFAESELIAVTVPSEDRKIPFCEHFGLCGGCSWQHLAYPKQLLYKQQQVVDNLTRIGGLTLPPPLPIMGARLTSQYRNKLDFTFTSQRWLTAEEMAAMGETRLDAPGLGYHNPGKYDRVFDVALCHLQPEPSNAMRLLVKNIAIKNNISFFDLRKQVGFLRTLTIRTAAATGEVMAILQVAYRRDDWIELILQGITDEFPQVQSIYYIVNGKRNDTFADLHPVCWRGNPHIVEKIKKPDGLGELQFRIGPKSFFQTNTAQAEELYRAVWKMAALTGHENVYDLYTGAGAIAQYVAAQARRVVGIEYVVEAIADAKINAQLNDIDNTDFYAGDLKDMLTADFVRTHGKPDVVITDPPRAGMHPDVCRALAAMGPQKIIYVSCNPATQARDLQVFREDYTIAAVQPIDMFPHTAHVENIVCLFRKN